MADALKSAASNVQNTASSGASAVGSGASSAASKVTGGGGDTSASSGSGSEEWNAMSEDQKKQAYDSLPEDQKHKQGYMEWISQGYQNKKENWMPWIEDTYLKWFTNDNKASYATKGALDSTKVTGVEQVDTAQDSVNNAVGQQVGKGGILQPVGDAASSEGINRAERGGKDDQGSYTGTGK